MSNITNLNQFRKVSFRSRLRTLYSKLDNSDIHKTMNISKRSHHYQSNLGEFLKIFRENKNFSLDFVSHKAGISPDLLKKAEGGDFHLGDGLMFRLCDIIGATQEINVFLEKMEESLQPEKKKSRQDLADSLLAYGIRFADDQKYESKERGKIVAFDLSKRQTRH